MLTNESPKLWGGLVLYAVSAIALYLYAIDSSSRWRATLPVLADVCALAGIWLSVPRGGLRNRRVANIFQGFRSGNIEPSTWFQKLFAVLGSVLVIASTVTIISL